MTVDSYVQKLSKIAPFQLLSATHQNSSSAFQSNDVLQFNALTFDFEEAQYLAIASTMNQLGDVEINF